ncbi:NAD(P)-binding protein [Marasmius fiardii PR-910]|nr:NAD(P)-binding protein [Marasmius fiardii PR-910]
MSKLAVIVGVTGNQGGSVSSRFLIDPAYRVRGLTRNPNSPVAKRLAAQGIEIVQANLDDVQTLIPAFAGANLIFSVTNYWEPFFRQDCREHARKLGISCREYAGKVEYEQGKNIADAAATTVVTLDTNGFIVSTLSHAGRCSGGKFKELYHFDAKADIFPDYVAKRYPDLAAKMSCVQTGFFFSSYKLQPQAYFAKTSDGVFEMRFPTDPDVPVPHLDVNRDTGNFVYAVSRMPPGKSYMAEGTTCSWSEYMKIWSAVTKKPVRYQQVSLEQMIEESPDKECGREVGDMFLYSSSPGYSGGDRKLLTAGEIRKFGIDCPMTGLAEWIREEDWSSVVDS